MSSGASEFLTLLLMLSCLSTFVLKTVHCDSQVPCYFIFGDSLADAGNNNDLQTIAKANYPPYGIDFPEGPTGRFTNGLNYADIIAKLLGFDDFIPPYASAKGAEVLKGVNYASGAAGILDETGQTQGDRFSMNKQLALHERTISTMENMLKSRTTTNEHLKKCIYTVGFGSNDYINNYFMPESYNSSNVYTPNSFARLLAEVYSTQLKKLYAFGARKVAIVGIAQLGLTPVELARQGLAGVVIVNAAVEFFNIRLKFLVEDLNKNHPDAHFTYLNTAGIITASNAITIAKLKSCCEVDTPRNFTCIRSDEGLCTRRDTYSFFDNIHPTEALNMVIAPRYYTALLPTDACPYDVQRLARI